MKQSNFKETEIGKVPEEWDLSSIDEIGEVVGGGTPSTKVQEFWDGDIAWLTPKDLSNCNFRYVSRGERNISRKGLEKSSAKILPPNSVLLTTRAPVGYVAIARNDISTNQGFRSVIPKKGVSSEYLYYLLKNNTHYLKSHASGTTFGELAGSTLRSLKFAFPNFDEQKSIAKILSDLDSKIELNNEMNKTLEAIGQALFKHWFIDFEFPNNDGKPYKSSGGEMVDAELGEIPKGWSVKKLGDYVDVVKGCSYRSDDLQESDKALVALKSIERGGGFKVDGLKQYIGKYKDEQIISPGEIVVSHTDITQKAEVLGKSAIVRKVPKFSTLIASLDLCIVRPVINMLNRSFVYFLLKTDNFQNHAFGYANGTTVLHLNKKAIPEYVFVLPPKDLIHKFGVIVNNIMEKIQENELNSETLTFMRDSLLPRLMSGRIRVKVAE